MIQHSEVSSEVNFWRDLESRVGSAIDLLGLAIEEGDNTLEESLVNEANAIALELRDNNIKAISLNSKSTLLSSIPVFSVNSFPNNHSFFVKAFKIINILIS